MKLYSIQTIRILVVLLMVCSSHLSVASETQKPNIVFIMADDLGWRDVGFNGTPFYETPHLNRLVKKGMKFNRAYSGGPNCLPTRACLLSGMYTPRTQIWTPGGRSKGNKNFMKLAVPGVKDTFPSKLTLKPSVTSIAEVLKSAGYQTARFGKWHVGPDTQGFDVSDPNGKGAAIGKKFYGNIDVHESLTDASCQFIEKNKEQPFFLYLCHWDVHSPIRARKEIVDKFQAKYDQKEWKRKWNPIYSAMIEAVDKSVGRIHAKLDELNLSDNTLFIFTSDNGGISFATTNKPLKGEKGSLSEGGVRVPTFMIWSPKIKPGSQCNTPITSVDYLPTFAKISGADLPQNQPVDGKSILPLMEGKEVLKDRAIFWHYPLYLKGSRPEGRTVAVHGTKNMYWRGVPSSMVMKGDWKLIQFFEDNSTVLYNLKEDISEEHDLSTKEPQRTKAMLKELKQWQTKTKAVIPTEVNPGFDTNRKKRRRGKK